MHKMKNNLIFIGSFLVVLLAFSNCSNTANENNEDLKKESGQKVNADTTSKVKEPEVQKSEKELLLASLVGDHKLTSISGFAGANAMMDYTRENGTWIAQGSAISEGMREAYDIELDAAAKKKLNSMKIQVSADLTVTLLCNGKSYYASPFNDEGMAYFLRKSPKNYSSLPGKLAGNSTFIGDNLYLYAKDGIAENEMASINVAEVIADVIVISYNKKSKQFEMNLFYGDCCDSATYYFN